MKKIIHTNKAPAAIGTYSQAVAVDHLLYVSGQVPLIPGSMDMVQNDFAAETTQVFENLKAIAEAGHTTLDHAIKLTVYLLDLGNFATVNEIMARYIKEPYPARAVIAVAGLPRGARVEIDAIIEIP